MLHMQHEKADAGSITRAPKLKQIGRDAHAPESRSMWDPPVDVQPNSPPQLSLVGRCARNYAQITSCGMA